MSRLIEADELRRKAEHCIETTDMFIEMIDEQPIVDAVEVIRCIDCCHHEDEEPGMVYCPNIVGGWVQNDFFCKDGSRGERR